MTRDPFRCARVTVPLDRAGQVKGKVALRVLRARATGRRRGVVVLLAGGPGQSAVAAYVDGGLGPLAPMRRTHDIVVFDQRGSGGSGLLRCPELERANILRAARPAARCAAKLGPRRAFYTSRDTADDLDAVRRALGVSKLSLYGVSYGTRTATAYALRYPARVQRLGAGLGDRRRRRRRAVGGLASARCRACCAPCAPAGAATASRRDPVADVAALVQRIGAARPAARAAARPPWPPAGGHAQPLRRVQHAGVGRLRGRRCAPPTRRRSRPRWAATRRRCCA